MKKQVFLSSTAYASNSSNAWYVNFNLGGYTDNYFKHYDYSVRCVRGGQYHFDSLNNDMDNITTIDIDDDEIPF